MASVLSQARDAFNRMQKLPLRFLAQELLEEATDNIDRQMRLRYSLGIALRG